MKNKISSPKNILSLLYLCLISAQIFAVNTLSIQAACGPAVGIPCNPIGSNTLSEAIVTVTLYLLSLIGLVALLFIVFAGVKYILSAGNEEKMKSAKDSFNSAVLGLAIALLAYGILSVIDYILNG